MTWTHTSRGRALDLLDPRPDDVDLTEIGRSISHLCRYNGCVRRFYSVAEHSVLVSRWLAAEYPNLPELRVAGLLHDAAEAYTGDITWPVQDLLFRGEYGRHVRNAYHDMQRRLDRLICDLVGIDVSWLHHDLVRQADLRILLDEREALLLGRPRPWAVESMGPLGVKVEGWSPDAAFETWCRELSCAVDDWSGRDLDLDVTP
jgi:hypothetical protein